MEGKPFLKSKEALFFSNVLFPLHNNTPDIIEALSLSIPAGKFIGITGRSGSGKSTLTRLIQRLYTPQQDKFILMEWISLSPIRSLYAKALVRLQESYLFSGSIIENIRLSKPSASEER